jgi:pimeloyl-ACP methyl ester carboxylesterase
MNDNIPPQFTEIDGLRIRYASGGGVDGSRCPAHERLRKSSRLPIRRRAKASMVRTSSPARSGRLRETAPTEEELRDYRESYAGDRFVKSMAYVRSYPRSLPPLRDLLPTVKVPVQVIYGNHDPRVPPAHADVLGRSLPRVCVAPLESGHFAWQDAAPEYAAAARAWIDGGLEQA